MNIVFFAVAALMLMADIVAVALLLLCVFRLRKLQTRTRGLATLCGGCAAGVGAVTLILLGGSLLGGMEAQANGIRIGLLAIWLGVGFTIGGLFVEGIFFIASLARALKRGRS